MCLREALSFFFSCITLTLECRFTVILQFTWYFLIHIWDKEEEIKTLLSSSASTIITRRVERPMFTSGSLHRDKIMSVMMALSSEQSTGMSRRKHHFSSPKPHHFSSLKPQPLGPLAPCVPGLWPGLLRSLSWVRDVPPGLQRDSEWTNGSYCFMGEQHTL